MLDNTTIDILGTAHGWLNTVKGCLAEPLQTTCGKVWCQDKPSIWWHLNDQRLLSCRQGSLVVEVAAHLDQTMASADDGSAREDFGHASLGILINWQIRWATLRNEKGSFLS